MPPSSFPRAGSLIGGQERSATISSSDLRKAAALIPGAYFFQTRISGPRDALYTIATSFVPAWWIFLRLTDAAPIAAAGTFVLGYLAFIAVYELGYLGNDLLDARRPGGRDRCRFPTGAIFVAMFAAVRFCLWLLISAYTGWIGSPVWLAATGMLVAIFAVHNLIAPPEPRLATFLQLALLRFTIPIIAAVPASTIPLVFVLALIFYVHLRLLAYVDSKKLLAMPSRKSSDFGLWQTALLLPVAILIAAATELWLPVELWLWYAGLYLGWALLARRTRSGQ